MAENGENNDAKEKAETERKPQSNLGKIEWLDLTVDNATRVKDFYAKVVGWSTEDVSMGSYDDFNMNLPGEMTSREDLNSNSFRWCVSAKP